MKHIFGGPWTLIKLELLRRYLQFFNTALQNQPSAENPFHRVYIDAFAGTGKCDVKVSDGATRTITGSALHALECTPAFDALHLVELKAAHARELRALADSHPERNVHIYKDDCNGALKNILSSTNWKSTRGVLFLDPYGMSVDWTTVEQIAATKALDVWYLFPLSAVYRQAAINFSDVVPSKAASLDKVLGTTDWRNVFYIERSTTDLLTQKEAVIKQRESSPAEIASYMHGRLCTLFKGWVSAPIILYAPNGAPMFSLFFAVSNPAPRAIALSKKAADHLFEMLKQQKIGRHQPDNELDTQQRLF
ncbi:hypothetical protein GCM10007860_25410 [Chitiniphilus shinanonensis]|uniref:Three-Cys-motif partner protein TcmP n=1 Tax=Chitiniphilus shinanonensis TaxID=553088 RepID=A0ABQ6BV82_9NEIS|nr:three-Cys-motif partner protein TcmP [Chitiniphilus shinanonensis]GLS05389.1 hypothetical protein GCM10007860_25410 [Chitiniphilus shinanonensis]